jgi:hypothetical protein
MAAAACAEYRADPRDTIGAASSRNLAAAALELPDEAVAALDGIGQQVLGSMEVCTDMFVGGADPLPAVGGPFTRPNSGFSFRSG